MFLLNDRRQIKLLFSRLMTELDFPVDTKLELTDEYQESFRFLLMFRSKFVECFRITAVSPISSVISHRSRVMKEGVGSPLRHLLLGLSFRKLVPLSPNSSEIQAQTNRFLPNSVHISLKTRYSSKDITSFVLKGSMFCFFRS